MNVNRSDTVLIVSFFIFITAMYYFGTSHSHYFMNDGITFVYNTMNIHGTTITTAWVVGNISITPPVITVNSHSSQMTEVTLHGGQKNYIFNLSESPTNVNVYKIALHRRVPLTRGSFAILFVPIFTAFMLFWLSKDDEKATTKDVLGLYLIVFTVLLIASITPVHYIKDTPFKEYASIKVIEPFTTYGLVFYTASPIPEYVTTVPTIECNHTYQNIIFVNSKIGLKLPAQCKTVIINSTPHAVSTVYYPDKYFFIALFIVGTFLFGITVLLYDYLIE